MRLIVSNMKQKIDFETKPIEVKFFLSPQENEAYEKFLATFTGKKGPYARLLVLERIEASRAGKTIQSLAP